MLSNERVLEAEAIFGRLTPENRTALLDAAKGLRAGELAEKKRADSGAARAIRAKFAQKAEKKI
jgi:hypothetical protein